ncbi:hypothetical protein QFC19_001566 [Naganishia cerealis]|uniref:Uncharacterized protein n=1 Tax=Naganishia cerealis TaxID=610337 RepID=A0ACC2WFB6_9TREE|nr:hypothetical protein QFC19_001566 [Naganishia cerealis]
MATNAPDPLSSQALLKDLDEVSKEIPNIIQYLGSAMGTLKDLDPARKDVWARNLTGLSGQYYGRLDRIQMTLRKVVRVLHERGSSPYAIRPPLPTHPLPNAFEIAKSPYSEEETEQVNDPSRSTEEAGTKSRLVGSGVSEVDGVDGVTAGQGAEKDGLSVYARRLEVAILQELQQALQEMAGEETSAMQAALDNGDGLRKLGHDDHDKTPNVADERVDD